MAEQAQARAVETLGAASGERRAAACEEAAASAQAMTEVATVEVAVVEVVLKAGSSVPGPAAPSQSRSHGHSGLVSTIEPRSAP